MNVWLEMMVVECDFLSVADLIVNLLLFFAGRTDQV